MPKSKLVRDKVVEAIMQSGSKVRFHIASKKELGGILKNKLKEEVDEFWRSGSTEEFIDILEVLDAIAEMKKFKKASVSQMKKHKAVKRGKFRKRIILDNPK